MEEVLVFAAKIILGIGSDPRFEFWACCFETVEFNRNFPPILVLCVIKEEIKFPNATFRAINLNAVVTGMLTDVCEVVPDQVFGKMAESAWLFCHGFVKVRPICWVVKVFNATSEVICTRARNQRTWMLIMGVQERWPLQQAEETALVEVTYLM